MTFGVFMLLLGMLALAGFVGFCYGYYFGCKAEARQMRQMYNVVNTSKLSGDV